MSAHDIKEAIGTVKAVALPVFHEFTGCRYKCQHLDQLEKKTAWKRWKDFDSVRLKHLPVSVMGLRVSIHKERRCLKDLPVLLYDRISLCTSVNELRKELFTRGRPIECIPPTS